MFILNISPYNVAPEKAFHTQECTLPSNGIFLLKTEVLSQITEAWRAERAKLFTLKWGQHWRLVRCKQKSQDIHWSYLPWQNLSQLMKFTQKKTR